jgi:hypothetical protein
MFIQHISASLQRLQAVAGLLLCCTLFAPTKSTAQFDEMAVRAAMVYSVAQFVEWPTSVMGNTTKVGFCHTKVAPNYAARLIEIERQPLFGMKTEVRAVGLEDSFKGCLVLVTDAVEKDAEKLLERTKGQSILVIGEGEAFARAGAGISFFVIGKTVSLAVNHVAIQKAQLKASSKLLNLKNAVHITEKDVK